MRAGSRAAASMWARITGTAQAAGDDLAGR